MINIGLQLYTVIKTAVELGVKWAFVEQDRCSKPSFESIKISFENLQRMMIDG